MLNLNKFPFFYEVFNIQIAILIISILCLSYFCIVYRKLLYWINTTEDIKIKRLDEIDLILCEKGIVKSILCLWLGLCLYLIFYVIE